MIRFEEYMEMANLLPQRKGDTIERTSTTHMGFPVYSPTIFYVIANRDRTKYPDGMTAQEIADEVIRASTRREELKPGEELAPEDWQIQVRTDKTLWSKFIRGINSMLSKSKDFVTVGTRAGGRGKSPSLFVPTPEALRREGGTKFMKGVDREYWKKDQIAPPVPTDGPEEAPEPEIDLHDQTPEELEDRFQSLFQK